MKEDSFWRQEADCLSDDDSKLDGGRQTRGGRFDRGAFLLRLPIKFEMRFTISKSRRWLRPEAVESLRRLGPRFSVRRIAWCTVATLKRRVIPVECYTVDGKTGAVLIDGKDYRLESGPLFLIKTSGDEIEDLPLALDSAALPPDLKQLQTLAAENAEIRTFFYGEPQEAP